METERKDKEKEEEREKWNVGVLGHFLLLKAELGRGHHGLIRCNFCETCPQSSIDPSTLDSKSSGLLVKHGVPQIESRDR